MLGAVKRACDRDRRPGRFILTGSVRAETGHRTWPGTGITETGAMRDGDLLGRLLETFVVAQLRSQAAVSEHR